METRILDSDYFSDYFIKIFPGFSLVHESGKKYFHNSSIGFDIIPYIGELITGISLSEIDSSAHSSSVSFISLHSLSEKSCGINHNYLINNFLLLKYAENLRTRAEKMNASAIMTRADISDLFSGRGRAEALVATNCPNRFIVPACVSGERILRGVLLDNVANSSVVNYIIDNHLI